MTSLNDFQFIKFKWEFGEVGIMSRMLNLEFESTTVFFWADMYNIFFKTIICVNHLVTT